MVNTYNMGWRSAPADLAARVFPRDSKNNCYKLFKYGISGPLHYLCRPKEGVGRLCRFRSALYKGSPEIKTTQL